MKPDLRCLLMNLQSVVSSTGESGGSTGESGVRVDKGIGDTRAGVDVESESRPE